MKENIFLFALLSFAFFIRANQEDDSAPSTLFVAGRSNYEKKFNENLNKPDSPEHVKQDKQCVFCNAVKDPASDLVVAQTKNFILVLNKFPYTCGHLLIVSKNHVPNIADLSKEELVELAQLQATVPNALIKILSCDGINLGINQGECAAATIPDHLHVQIVPRTKKKEHGFLTAACNTKVLPCDLKQLQKEFTEHFKDIEQSFKK